MRTISLISSFLVFLILLTSTLAQTNTITDESIYEICNHAKNPSLCLKNLRSLNGKRLFPNPIATLGSTSINMAQSRANRTVALTWTHCHGVTLHKPELRMKYYECFLKYADVMNQLKQAKKYMVSGATRSVRKRVVVCCEWS
ncbi:hypothetical protein CDL12_20613 [Handroanthus impetiginosus]|uniref:Pectinesterase inhibitor domain-containing protein n=1 Tax=Handroanthus impetiginosus TaxID=429701 RepID=A0A2G9GPA9_9LAMI|nr:hypothetical protein CDL12_20613 [Handroanthus impetiginosus]